MGVQDLTILANSVFTHLALLYIRSKPRRSTLKINVDAALSPIYSSIAAVARDWKGEYIFCLLYEGKHQLPSPGES